LVILTIPVGGRDSVHGIAIVALPLALTFREKLERREAQL